MMKKWLKTLCLATSLMLPGLLCADSVKKWEVDRIKIRLESVSRVPGESASNGKVTTVKFSNNWLLVYIDYSPKASGGTGWVDDVVLNCQVAVPITGKNADWVVFEGKTHFWTVSADGRNRTALMIIPPQLLDRYLPAGKRASLSSLLARVAFSGPDGKVTGYDLHCPGMTNKSSAAKYFNEIYRKSSTIKVEGGLFPREMTPWRYDKMDQTDLVRIDND